MFDDGRGVAMDFEPRQRFAKDAAVRERALPARVGPPDLAQASLEAEKLTQAFDVSARERHFTHA